MGGVFGGVLVVFGCVSVVLSGLIYLPIEHGFWCRGSFFRLGGTLRGVEGENAWERGGCGVEIGDGSEVRMASDEYA